MASSRKIRILAASLLALIAMAVTVGHPTARHVARQVSQGHPVVQAIVQHVAALADAQGESPIDSPLPDPVPVSHPGHDISRGRQHRPQQTFGGDTPVWASLARAALSPAVTAVIWPSQADALSPVICPCLKARAPPA